MGQEYKWEVQNPILPPSKCAWKEGQSWRHQHSEGQEPLYGARKVFAMHWRFGCTMPLSSQWGSKVWRHNLQIKSKISRETEVFSTFGLLINRGRMEQIGDVKVWRRFANYQRHIIIELIVLNIYMKSPVDFRPSEICTETNWLNVIV